MQTRRAHSILITEAHNVMMLLSYRRLNQTPRPQYFGQIYVSKITCNEYTYPPTKTSTKYWVKFPSMLFWDHFLPLIIGGRPACPQSRHILLNSPWLSWLWDRWTRNLRFAKALVSHCGAESGGHRDEVIKQFRGFDMGFTLIFSLF